MGSSLKPRRLLLVMLMLSVVAVRRGRGHIRSPVVMVRKGHLLRVVKNGTPCGVESSHWVLWVHAGSKDCRRHRSGVVVGRGGRVGLLNCCGSLKLCLSRGWIGQKWSKLDPGSAELVKGTTRQVKVVGVGCRGEHLQATAVAVGDSGCRKALQVKGGSGRSSRGGRGYGVHLQRDLVVGRSRASRCSGLAVRESRNEAVDGERKLDGRRRCLEVVAGRLPKAKCCGCGGSHGGTRTLSSSAPQ